MLQLQGVSASELEHSAPAGVLQVRGRPSNTYACVQMYPNDITFTQSLCCEQRRTVPIYAIGSRVHKAPVARMEDSLVLPAAGSIHLLFSSVNLMSEMPHVCPCLFAVCRGVLEEECGVTHRQRSAQGRVGHTHCHGRKVRTAQLLTHLTVCLHAVGAASSAH